MVMRNNWLGKKKLIRTFVPVIKIQEDIKIVPIQL